MPQRAFIHQIFYDDKTRAQLDPGFLPLDNTANLRPDWSEYWPIRRFVLANNFFRDAGYGFLSPKFGAKTGLTAADVHRFIAEEEADVFLFSPWLDESAMVLNVFQQAALHDPGIPTLFAEVLAQFAPGIDTLRLVMDSRHVVFCNYFVARPTFWQRWFSLCEPIFHLCEHGDDRLAARLRALVPHDGRQNPAKVFLIERVASFILATESRWKVRAYDPARLPLSKAPVASREVFERLDALKRAWRTDGDPKHMRAYRELMASLADSLRARAAGFDIPR
ncbi:MAG: hypothetical protein WCR51_00370 [Planctomycetia bacterium]